MPSSGADSQWGNHRCSEQEQRFEQEIGFQQQTAEYHEPGGFNLEEPRSARPAQPQAQSVDGLLIQEAAIPLPDSYFDMRRVGCRDRCFFWM